MSFALLMLVLPLPALAALGGDVSTVAADQSHMKAAMKQIAQNQDYAVHEMKAASGTVIREFVSPAGRVFAVAWSGPFLPDLRQLLGTYFDQYSQAAQARRARRAPLNIQEPGLVVQSSGHMRAFSGKAYVPEMMPQSVRAEQIR